MGRQELCARAPGSDGVRRAAARSFHRRGQRKLSLARGDKVAIIEPAAAAEDRELIDAARQLLEEWGLSVTLPAATQRHFYLAGTDRERAAALESALGDRETRAIFCARGGYGTMRLFPYLRSEWVHGPKLLVGYSDVTALHLAAARLWPGIALVHGPNVATKQLLGSGAVAEQNRAMLKSALFERNYGVDLPVAMLRAGTAAGRLVGGCLTLVAATLGSPFAIDARNRILFLEDTKEAPYRIDRLLVQLRNAGVLDGVRGLVFGQMHECEDGSTDLTAALMDVLEGTSFPIGFGLAAGHGETNIALPLDGEAILDGRAGRFRVAAHRDKMTPQ